MLVSMEIARVKMLFVYVILRMTLRLNCVKYLDSFEYSLN